MKPISLELVQKYLNGDCSAEEEEIVLNWYNSFESKEDPYNKLSSQQQQALRMRMLVNIESGMHTEQTGGLFKLKYLKYAAYVAGVAAAIIFIINTTGVFTPKPSPEAVASILDDEVVITNKTQSIYKHILPDKSIVWLSPGAQINFKKQFNKSLREVRLSGESFFEVTKDKAHPFVIYSNHITTRVWGTSFRVRDIKNTSTAEVDVVTGKVSVETADAAVKKNALNHVMLLPKQKAVFKKDNDNLAVARISTISPVSMWKKANLSFENVPLKDVIQALNKQYKVEITLQDKDLNSYMLQADFNDQSLPDIMEMLKKLLKLSYVTDGNKFLLQKENTK